MTAGNLPKGKVPKLERWDKYLLLMLPSDDGSFLLHSLWKKYTRSDFFMPKIKELLKEHERIWFYIDNDETGIHFMREVEKMGGKFVDSSTTKEHLCGKIMAFGRNNIVAYVSLMIWWMSFSDEYKCENKVLKIDYGKFKRGENDYIINSCNFKKEN